MIYHCSISPVQRSKGRSACAAAAYRSASILHDTRYGVTHDYTKKKGIIQTGLIGWPGGREDLWNSAEKSETRKDSIVAREIRIALNPDFRDSLNEQIVRDFAGAFSQKHKVAVDYAIHEPSPRGDQRNVHAHLLFTARPVDPLTGAFEPKKDRSWNFEGNGRNVVEARELWADIYNSYVRDLELAAQEICHLSYVDQGVDKVATTHQGPARTANIRKGDKPEKIHSHLFGWEPSGGGLREEIEKVKAELEKAEYENISKFLSSAPDMPEASNQPDMPTPSKARQAPTQIDSTGKPQNGLDNSRVPECPSKPEIEAENQDSSQEIRREKIASDENTKGQDDRMEDPLSLNLDEALSAFSHLPPDAILDPEKLVPGIIERIRRSRSQSRNEANYELKKKHSPDSAPKHSVENEANTKIPFEPEDEPFRFDRDDVDADLDI